MPLNAGDIVYKGKYPAKVVKFKGGKASFIYYGYEGSTKSVVPKDIVAIHVGDTFDGETPAGFQQAKAELLAANRAWGSQVGRRATPQGIRRSNEARADLTNSAEDSHRSSEQRTATTNRPQNRTQCTNPSVREERSGPSRANRSSERNGNRAERIATFRRKRRSEAARTSPDVPATSQSNGRTCRSPSPRNTTSSSLESIPTRRTIRRRNGNANGTSTSVHVPCVRPLRSTPAQPRRSNRRSNGNGQSLPNILEASQVMDIPITPSPAQRRSSARLNTVTSSRQSSDPVRRSLSSSDTSLPPIMSVTRPLPTRRTTQQQNGFASQAGAPVRRVRQTPAAPTQPERSTRRSRRNEQSLSRASEGPEDSQRPASPNPAQRRSSIEHQNVYIPSPMQMDETRNRIRTLLENSMSQPPPRPSGRPSTATIDGMQVLCPADICTGCFRRSIQTARANRSDFRNDPHQSNQPMMPVFPSNGCDHNSVENRRTVPHRNRRLPERLRSDEPTSAVRDNSIRSYRCPTCGMMRQFRLYQPNTPIDNAVVVQLDGELVYANAEEMVNELQEAEEAEHVGVPEPTLTVSSVIELTSSSAPTSTQERRQTRSSTRTANSRINNGNAVGNESRNDGNRASEPQQSSRDLGASSFALRTSAQRDQRDSRSRSRSSSFDFESDLQQLMEEVRRNTVEARRNALAAITARFAASNQENQGQNPGGRVTRSRGAQPQTSYFYLLFDCINMKAKKRTGLAAFKKGDIIYANSWPCKIRVDSHGKKFATFFGCEGTASAKSKFHAVHINDLNENIMKKYDLKNAMKIAKGELRARGVEWGSEHGRNTCPPKVTRSTEVSTSTPSTSGNSGRRSLTATSANGHFSREAGDAREARNLSPTSRSKAKSNVTDSARNGASAIAKKENPKIKEAEDEEMEGIEEEKTLSYQPSTSTASNSFFSSITSVFKGVFGK